MTQAKVIQLIGLLATLAIALLTMLINNPTQAETWTALIKGTIVPILELLAGMVFAIWVGKGDVAARKADEAKALASASYYAALNAGKIPGKKPDKKPYGARALAPDYSGTLADIDLMLQAVEAGLISDGITSGPVIKAERFYDAVAAYDMRTVPRETRLATAKALMGKVKELDVEAWSKKINIAIPTPEQCAQKTRFMYQFKKDYEKANGISCGDAPYTLLSSLLGYFNNMYEAQAGLDQLTGTVDWSSFGNSQYSAQMVGWHYANLIV